MILLTVLSYNGAPTTGLAASFDELGGSIGRADNNQLVLPDPERSISRVHARILFRGGAYAVVDNGSNPVAVNGRPLAAGVEQTLQPGDQLQIGGYVLAVSEGAAARVSADPFADLFGDISSGLATPAAQPAPAAPSPLRAPAWPSAPAPTPAAGFSPGQIPHDWDPFAAEPVGSLSPLSPVSPAGQPGQAFGDLQFGPSSAAADSLDDLFGLGGTPLVGDPLGAAPQDALLIQANTAGHADPLQALAGAGRIAAQSMPDHGSELNAAMPLARPASAPAAPAIPMDAVFSWDDAPEEGPKTVPHYALRAEAVGALAPSAAAVPPVPRPSTAPPPSAAPASAGEAALLAALLEGLDAPGLRIEALTPDLMRLVGVLLREATRGSVELLVARAALKRELRAEMTMIVARENNPLKFSPSAEVALQYLLSKPLPGFMAAAPAMRDAFDDLRAHQLGVMAGMKAALDGVLDRFNPQQLEAQLTQKSKLNALLPSLRKARLWELFQDLFGQLSSEAQDDFEELFGKAFLRAYEAQLDLLGNEPGPK
jgi:FHA domain-containing protein